MKYTLRSASPELQRTACAVVAIYTKRRLSEAAKQLDQASKGALSGILRRGDMDGDTGQTLMLHNPPNLNIDRILLVGCGKEKEINDKIFRKINAVAAKTLQKSGATQASTFLTELKVKDRDLCWKVRQTVTVYEDSLYRFDQTKSQAKPVPHPLRTLNLMVPENKDIVSCKQALAEGLAIGAGISLAKDLGNLPGNICTPSYLADQARNIKKGNTKIRVNVLNEDRMEKLGMGALLSVTRGSAEPAKLIVLDYQGGKKNNKPVVLVGKGITFDSGGISLKPGAAMDEMKFDMCGAASVLGTFKACAQMQLPINIVAIIASAENMPGSRASKPGDVVTTLSSQTVEILNTDAEGRLVLCDALTYAQRYKPQAVIDVATLTGACIIALGHHATGLLANNDDLAKELLKAGETSADRAWQLPLWDDYQEQLDSNFADMANIGGRSAGTITAACFLSRFTKDCRWAHLDIAGVAWHSGNNKGATGRPVTLLTQYLMDRAGKNYAKK